MNHSPLPVTKEVAKAIEVLSEKYTFPEAMQKVIDGKKVSRLEWNNEDTYGFLNGKHLSIHYSDKKENFQWIVSDGDMLGTDWIVVGVNLKERK